MKILKIEDLCALENPTPGQFYRPEFQLDKDGFKSLGGLVCVLVPGSQVPYHYHTKRDSILMPIMGEAVETVEGKETVVRPGDVLLIPAGEKHSITNRSDREFRFLELFTHPPMASDFIKAD
ncbi:MAG: cupin domain-containing protein [Syntrophales bacterium LBB04]|nr:cupin domain-containing protein [Syntrophales bacterium LBB04]